MAPRTKTHKRASKTTQGSRKAGKTTTARGSKTAAKRTTKKAAKKAAKRTTKKAAKKAAKRTTKKAAKKAAKRTTKKAAKEAAKRTTKKAAKKAAKRTTKKAAKKAARKTPRRAAKRATNSTTPTIRHGVVGHTEFASTDPLATKKWAQAVLGWDFGEPMPTPTGDYHMWSSGDNGGGGIRNVMPDEPAGTIPYVEVDGLEKTLKAASKAGATVLMPPTPVPGAGRIAVVVVPGGVMVGFYGK